MGSFGLGGLQRKNTWLSPVDTVADLPPTAVDGSVAVARDTNIAYEYDAAIPGWIPLTTGGGGGGGGGIPATSVVSETSFGQVPAVGASLNYAREDHTHGTPSTPQAVSDYAGKFEQATIGIVDIGLNQWGWFWRTTDSKLFLVRNRAGVLYAVETTAL